MQALTKVSLLLILLSACRAEPPKSTPGDSGCEEELGLDSTTSSIASYQNGAEIRLNMRVDQFKDGPAQGARHISFEVDELRAVIAELVNGSYLPPHPVTLATGPAPLVVWAPQSARPEFAGDWSVPTGRLQGIELAVSAMVVTDADGNDHEVVFGPQRTPSGLLRFRPPPGTPPADLSSGELIGWELLIPAGANGALHPEPDGRYRLDPMLPGGVSPHPQPFGFSERRLLVRYASGVSEAAIDSFQDQLGAETVWASPTGLRAVEFGGTDWWSVSTKFIQFRASPLVAFTSLDPVQSLAGHDTTFVDDPWYASEQGWLWDARVAPSDDASTDYAWSTTTGSRSVVIGFIDAGLDYNHPDLVNNLYVNVGEFPDDLLLLCGLDPDALGLTIEEALDFDADGYFTLNDLNADLDDDTLRNETLDLLEICGYPVSATASTSAYDVGTAVVQADDFLSVFADGIDTEGNGYIDDFFGANFRVTDSRCADGTWDPASCNDWDINPDERCDTTLPHCDETDGIQHGTQMAGLAAAQGNNTANVSGVAMSARVLEARCDDADTNSISYSMAMQAADYLIEQGAQIIVCPWGSPNAISPACAEDFAAESGAEFEARPEALFIFASGNESVDCDDPDMFCHPAESTASNLISVGATYHQTVDDATSGVESGDLLGWAPFANHGEQTVLIAAPGGVDLPSVANGFADYGYAQYSPGQRSYTYGTSASAAIVGGIAALRISACGDPVDGAALASEILSTARDRSADLTCGGDLCVAGGAFVDAAALVNACVGP